MEAETRSTQPAAGRYTNNAKSYRESRESWRTKWPSSEGKTFALEQDTKAYKWSRIISLLFL